MPPDMAQAIAANGGLPFQLEDPDTHEIFLVVEQPAEVTLDIEYINAKLDEGIAAVDAGQVVPWDPERIKQEGRRLLAERRAKQ